MHELSELQEFFVFMAEGAIISLIFDFFRGFRKNFSANNIAIYIEDGIFLLLTSIIFIFSILYFANGVLRFYIFLGIFLGIAVYTLTLSKKCVIILYSVIKLCKYFFTFLLKITKKLGKVLKL